MIIIIKKLTELSDIGRQLFNEITLLKDKIQDHNPESDENVPSQLSPLGSSRGT